MAYGAATNERPVSYGDFQISVVPADGGFQAWIERLDGGPVSCGYSLSRAGSTRKCVSADEARAAAMSLIDTEQVRVRP